MRATGQGTAMQAHRIRARFVSGTGGRYADRSLDERIVEIRKWLRSDLSLPQIAHAMSLDYDKLSAFIKRRRLCDLRARKEFITLQESLRKEEERDQ